jgi:hypothetical protein
MSASDPKQTPALWRPPQGSPDIDHQSREWTSGSMGGGKVPADYEWTSNPKTYAEDLGVNIPPHAVPQKSSATKT